jgi:RHS repeat-associated protein
MSVAVGRQVPRPCALEGAVEPQRHGDLYGNAYRRHHRCGGRPADRWRHLDAARPVRPGARLGPQGRAVRHRIGLDHRRRHPRRAAGDGKPRGFGRCGEVRRPPLSIGDAEDVLYVHTDHLGSPKKITDDTRSVVWDAAFTPFGEEDSIAGAETANWRFPGQYHDAEAGLSYNYRRTYDPALGRYLQSDPIGLAGGLNTYAYFKSRPTINVDRSGLQSAPGRISPLPFPAFATPYTPENEQHTRNLIAVCEMAWETLTGILLNAVGDDHVLNCEEEWRKARQRCRQLIYEELEQNAGRRKKRSVRGVTGGYSDVE